MGVDISFYIQKKNNANEWENVFLYNKNNEIVSINEIGYDAYDYLKENWGMSTNEEDIKDLAVITGWILEKEKEDELLVPYYVATYTNIKYLAASCNEAYDVDEEYEKIQEFQFWENLKNEIRTYLTFADCDFINSDNIRVIAFVGY